MTQFYKILKEMPSVQKDLHDCIINSFAKACCPNNVDGICKVFNEPTKCEDVDLCATKITIENMLKQFG